MAVRTPIGMMSFPHLFTPRPVNPGDEPRYSVTLVFDPEAQKSAAYKELIRAVDEAIDRKLGAGRSKDPKTRAKLRLPFRDAGEKAYAGYAAGKVFIQPWTKSKPGIVDGTLADITVPSDVWAGQLARATVNPFYYDNNGNRGVGLMLNNVQITDADQPRMDGRKNASDDFGDALTSDDDKDIPF